MEADCPQPTSPPVFQVVKSRELCSVRLTADVRWLDERAKSSFSALGPQRSFATWLRGCHVPTFHDLRSFSVRDPADETDDPPVLCWRAKARVPTGVLAKLLSCSGSNGVIVTTTDRTNPVCWAADDADLKTVHAHCKRVNGRLVANRRGLGICVPKSEARQLYVDLLGEEAAGTKGCPTFVGVIPPHIDPHALGEVITDRKRKDGRHVWYRAKTAEPTLNVEVEKDDGTRVQLQMLPSDPPRASYLEAAKRNRRKKAKKTKKEQAATAEPATTDVTMRDAQPASSETTLIASLRAENAMLRDQVSALTRDMSEMRKHLATLTAAVTANPAATSAAAQAAPVALQAAPVPAAAPAAHAVHQTAPTPAAAHAAHAAHAAAIPAATTVVPAAAPQPYAAATPAPPTALATPPRAARAQPLPELMPSPEPEKRRKKTKLVKDTDTPKAKGRDADRDYNRGTAASSDVKTRRKL